MPSSRPNLLHSLIAAVLAASAPSLRAQTFTEPARFAAEELFHGNGISAVQFDPDGRLLLIEKQGRVLIALPNDRGGFNPPAEFADLRAQVSFTAESGLLGLALDPDYRTTRNLYLFHTTATDQRLVRLRARPDLLAAEPGDPAVVLSGLPRIAPHHKAGDIHIRPADPDNVVIALGDDAQETLTRNPESYAGKIIRVHKATGRGAVGNPYYEGDGTSIRSRVWAMGFRNPFRFVPHPTNLDILYVAENGGPANVRPREDRVSWVRKGADCAWSNVAYAAGAASAWFNPTDAKCKVLATDPPSTVGIALATGGPFAAGGGSGGAVLYVCNHGYPAGAYPTQGSIRRWRLTGAEWDGVEPLPADGANRFVSAFHGVDLEFGPDGALYASSTHGEGATGGWYVMRRIRPTGIPTALAKGPEGNRKVTRGGRLRVARDLGRPILTWTDLRGRQVLLAP